MSAVGVEIPRVRGRRASPFTLTLVHAVALLLAVVSLAVVLGVDERGAALAFGILIAVGELTRWSGPRSRPAPLAAAGALAYALLGENAGRRTDHGVLEIVAVVVAAALIGCVPHVARGRGPRRPPRPARPHRRLRRRLLQPLYSQGRLMGWGGPSYALLLVSLLVLTALCDAVLAAAMARRTRWPFGPLLRDG